MQSRQLTLLPDLLSVDKALSRRTQIRSKTDAIRVSPEMEAGRAGEYLVLADLLLNGWVAYPTSQGVPYDVAVDIGKRVIRVQVKSTLMPKNSDYRNGGAPLYVFHTKRAGKAGKRRYGADDFDIRALVGLDRRLVAYYALRESRHDCIGIRVPGLSYGNGGPKFRVFDQASFDKALISVLADSEPGLPKHCEAGARVAHETQPLAVAAALGGDPDGLAA